MRITTKGRYALRASIALAKMAKENKFVSINAISKAEDISPVFLEQIFFKLKKAGIVKSVRGPAGGFAFTRPLDSLTVKEIMYASSEEMIVLPCDRNNSECERENDCISHNVIVMVTELINDFLDGITLKMLLEEDRFKPKT